MRKNLGAKEILYPMPVLIIGTYDKNGKANAMNAAWGGISGDKEICVCIGSDHKTTQNLIESKAFTVSIATEKTEIVSDFVGIVSGKKDENKMEKSGLTVEKSEFVNAPLFAQYPLALECEVISYENEHLFGKIVNVCASEEILTDGKIDVEKLAPITYDPVNFKYYKLNQIVGNAFSDGKKLK